MNATPVSWPHLVVVMARVLFGCQSHFVNELQKSLSRQELISSWNVYIIEPKSNQPKFNASTMQTTRAAASTNNEFVKYSRIKFMCNLAHSTCRLLTLHAGRPIMASWWARNYEQCRRNFGHNLNKKICKLHATIPEWQGATLVAGGTEFQNIYTPK